MTNFHMGWMVLVGLSVLFLVGLVSLWRTASALIRVTQEQQLLLECSTSLNDDFRAIVVALLHEHHTLVSKYRALIGSDHDEGVSDHDHDLT